MASSDPASRTTSSRSSQLEAHHILHSRTQGQWCDSSNAPSSNSGTRGAGEGDPSQARYPKANPLAVRDIHSASSTAWGGSLDRQRDVRTLPPWIDSFGEGEHSMSGSRLADKMLSSPSRAHSAHHHYNPTALTRRMSQDGFVDHYDDAAHGANERRADSGFFGGPREPVKGRKWDHARQGDPVIMQSSLLQSSSPWRTYIKSSMYGPALAEDCKRVDEDFLQQQTPGYEKPWRGDIEGNVDADNISSLLHSKKKRKTLIARVQHNLLTHPLVPLICRLVVLTTSLIALSLSASVYHLCRKYFYAQNPSTTMAVVVDVVAIPYIVYMTWDEYTGKPLGLRSPKAKIRLVLLDLFFIIFESANLSLAFAALTDDNGSCQVGQNGSNYVICNRVKALCGFLMVSLIGWSMTLSLSIFRLVERVGGRDE